MVIVEDILHRGELRVIVSVGMLTLKSAVLGLLAGSRDIRRLVYSIFFGKKW